MTASILPFKRPEKFYASDNLQPSKIGGTVKAWADVLEGQEPPHLPGFPLKPEKVFQAHFGSFNFQLWKIRDGYIWQQWAGGIKPFQLEKFNLYRPDRREA